MKSYQSPLSIGGILLFIAGTYLSIRMLMGAWPTSFAFIFLGLGIVMLVLDYFIRKSGLSFSTKLIVQSLCVVVPLVIGYLYFAEKI
jgi:hypothetical protein